MCCEGELEARLALAIHAADDALTCARPLGFNHPVRRALDDAVARLHAARRALAAVQ